MFIKNILLENKNVFGGQAKTFLVHLFEFEKHFIKSVE